MTSQRLRLPRGPASLSSRLLLLTIAFVMVSEVLIYAPSIARFRIDYLDQRIAVAHLATLALEATPDNMVSNELKSELLEHAEAFAIVIAKPGDVRRILAGDMPPQAEALYDLRDRSVPTLLGDAFEVLFRGGDRVIRVIGASQRREGVVVEVVMDESPLRRAMIEYSWRILQLSIIISLFTAAAVYLTLRWMFVRPVRRLVENMMAFRDAPEDPARVIVPSGRRDELGVAQRGLADMEEGLRAALRQQARLAALGAALAKINHDLRNILAAARLVSDRLADSTDPRVKRMAPTLIGSIDRAVALCTQTLDYARDEPPVPARQRFALGPLIDEAAAVAAMLAGDKAAVESAVAPETIADADRDQLFRVLVNLMRNAAEAGARRIRVTASQTGDAAPLVIEVADDGPGIPDKARQRLFQPFAGSARAGGTGLGLAIGREILAAHGGSLELAASSQSGTVFRLTLPPPVERPAARRAAE